MALSDLTAAEQHRRIANDFTDRVQRVTDWAAPAPVAGWAARDVVEHLVTWLPGSCPRTVSSCPGTRKVADDPVSAWIFHAETVGALLDDPERAPAQYSHERVSSMPVAEAIDRFYTSDIFMHTWDLARASGQDVRLEPAFCTELLAGMEPTGEAMRSSGQYGPKVEVPADADPQTRMIGSIGRDPSWRRPTPRRRELLCGVVTRIWSASVLGPVMGWTTVASGTSRARAISAVVKPPRSARVAGVSRRVPDGACAWENVHVKLPTIHAGDWLVMLAITLIVSLWG